MKTDVFKKSKVVVGHQSAVPGFSAGEAQASVSELHFQEGWGKGLDPGRLIPL